MIIRKLTLGINPVTFSSTPLVPVRHARSIAGRLVRSGPLRPSIASSVPPVTSSSLQKTPNAVETVQEQFFALSSDIDPEFLESFDALAPPSFNLAPYANKSHVIQQLVKLGVDLSKVEHDRDMAYFLIHADFDRHIKPHIRWLVDRGIKPDELGKFITRYPRVFNETLDILQQRVDYLSSKKFPPVHITRMLNKYPPLLKYCFTEVDAILGFVQKEYSLDGSSIRAMLVKFPSLVSLEPMQVRVITFAMKEEMGWSKSQMMLAVSSTPSLLACDRQCMVNIFDHLANQGGISQQLIAKSPGVLTGDLVTVKQRLAYLKKLKRDQFDPTEPLYVPLAALYSVSDRIFATKYALTSLEDYDSYLKQL